MQKQIKSIVKNKNMHQGINTKHHAAQEEEYI